MLRVPHMRVQLLRTWRMLLLRLPMNVNQEDIYDSTTYDDLLPATFDESYETPPLRFSSQRVRALD